MTVKSGFVGTVEMLPDGRIGVKELPHFTQVIGDPHPRHPFGGWLACDIGKRVYRKGTTLYMENAEQMARRLQDTV